MNFLGLIVIALPFKGLIGICDLAYTDSKGCPEEHEESSHRSRKIIEYVNKGVHSLYSEILKIIIASKYYLLFTMK